MSDTCVLIGVELLEGVDRCCKQSTTVDLSRFMEYEITSDIVQRMIEQHKEHYVFTMDPKTKVVTITWDPELAQRIKHAKSQTRPRKTDKVTASLTSRCT